MKLLHVTHRAAAEQYETARDIWCWPDMKNHIEDYCDSCQECKENRNSKVAQEPVFLLDLHSYNPADYWSADLFKTPKVGSQKLRTDYLVVVDMTSGLLSVHRVSSKRGDAVVKALT